MKTCHVLALVLALGAAVAALPRPLGGPVVQSLPPQQPLCPDYCKGTRFQNGSFVCGDPRLGPVQLPQQIPINVTTSGYDRFGGLCPGAFLFTWYNETAKSYIYPSQAGYLSTTSHAALKGETTLRPGVLLDRFGSGSGEMYLSPYGTPYEQRSLPPSNLAVAPGSLDFPFNYRVYEVMRPLTVMAGPVASWFGQPGLGTKFETKKSVPDLVRDGVLRKVGLGELVDGYGQPL